MQARLATLWETLRTNFWFVPSLMAGGAVLVAFVMLTLDARLENSVIRGLPGVYAGGPEGARSLLSTVASSVITVAGTTFSITIAALTLASSQYGPLLLRNFVRDRGNQAVLGTFIATFLYCLLILRTIRAEAGLADTEFVPHLAVSVAMGLAVASVAVLIYFIHHIATAIQADTIITAVSTDLHTAITRLFPTTIGQHQPTRAPASLEADRRTRATQTARAVTVAESGYLQAIDAEALLHLAIEHQLTIELFYRPGAFLVRGSPLAQVWPVNRFSPSVRQALRDACVVGHARTQSQDVEFAINQLVQIAVRALSPGVNDPFTAIICIDRLGAVLCQLAGRTMPDAYRYDDDGYLRVITPPVTFAHLVNVACDQIRQYGRSSVAVTIRLLEMLERVADYSYTDEQRTALLRQVEMIWHGSQQTLAETADRADVERQYLAVVHGLREASSKD
ncbi:MAG: DUF2254 domain-containing protein [Chloroflexaceae bacterium]|jgi:uncharacterized membrane protein|nr:DUF2254 domain-containing protein [Chloroflexaceae bacterium]